MIPFLILADTPQNYFDMNYFAIFAKRINFVDRTENVDAYVTKQTEDIKIKKR